LPTLMDCFRGMVGSEKLLNLQFEAPQGKVSAIPSDSALSVRIYSFSFHRGGVPKDETGNGGGFVFDGRSIPNPGREERFKNLTGKDAPVIEYLDQQESAHEFLEHVRALVDASVTEYQRRGFKNLMASFGCTGGQHRSVYLAEQLAKHLRAKDGVNVTVHHRELEKATADATAVAAELGKTAS
jgi:RNase adaptor protein for sRNA GlmZ degradation